MKQLCLAMIVIVAVAALATVGTYASFSDTENSVGNYLGTGGLDLQLGDDAPEVIRHDSSVEYPSAIAEDFGEDPLGDSVTETWLLPNADVGDTVNSCVYMRNLGSLPGGKLDVYCNIQNIDFYGGTSDKDRVMVINNLVYHNSSAISIVWTNSTGQHYNSTYMADEDGDGRITLNDLKLHGIPNLPVPDTSSARLEMSITFYVPPGIDPNQYQGDEVRMTITFNLVS